MQVARLLGAGRVIAAGRNHDALAEVTGLGADAVINTAVSDDALAEAFAAETGGGYDVVLDFLWGRPTELLLKALVPNRIGQSKPTRFRPENRPEPGSRSPRTAFAPPARRSTAQARA